MRRRAIALAVAACILASAGCVSSRPAGPASAGGSSSSGGSTPEKTFEVIRDAMLANDLPTAFEQYSERKKRMEGGLEGFQKKFESNRNEWYQLFTGARVTFVAIDRDQATAVVLWGNGERYPAVSFIRENGYWKIDQ